MEGVANGSVPDATAAGIFPPYLCAAVKTGTAQTALPNQLTDDWMIGFAPANNPQVAVAVVVPFQSTSPRTGRPSPGRSCERCSRPPSHRARSASPAPCPLRR